MVAVGGLLATGLSVATMGCGLSPDYVTESKAAVLLIVASINGGVVLDSEVRYGTLSETGAFVCEDEVPVAVAVRNKNPGVPAPIIPSHVLITGYEVRYYRSDGRSAEGIDVPYRITGNLSTEVDVATSGTSDVIIEVVRRQAKLEPPLSNIEQSTILTAFAEVTIYGETISGDRVQGSGRLQIDFADYLDEETSCPSN
jgi:hypothetical protein